MIKPILTLLITFASLLTYGQIITFPAIPELCADNPPVNLTVTTNPNVKGGTWKCLNCDGFNPIADDSVTFNPAARPSGYTYNLRYMRRTINDSADINLKVNPIPNVNISTVDQKICETSGSLLLNAIPFGGVWTGNGTSSSYFNPLLSGVKKDEKNKLMYAYKSPITGCINKDSLEIYVEAAPTVNITTPEPYALCEGNIFTLNATYANAEGIKWSSMDGNVAANLYSVYNVTDNTYTPDSNDIARGEITLHITTSIKTGDVCPAAIDSIKLSILRKPNLLPIAKDSGCEEFTTMLTAINTASTIDNLTYKWNFGDDNGYEHGNDQMIHTWATPGTYTVSVISSNKGKCPDTSYGKIMVYENPNASFTTIPGDAVQTANRPFFTFVNTTINGAKPYTNVWSWGDDTPNETNPEHPVTQRVKHKFSFTSVSDTGNRYIVTLQVTSAEGCISQFMSIVTINPAPAGPIAAFPNPAGDEVVLTREYEGNLNVAILSPEGQKIEDITWDESTNELVIKRNQLKPGIYYIITTDEYGHQKREKVIFQ